MSPASQQQANKLTRDPTDILDLLVRIASSPPFHTRRTDADHSHGAIDTALTAYMDH